MANPNLKRYGKIGLNMKNSKFKPKLITALLLSIIVLEAVSLFLYTRIDKIVHSDFYNYGLKFAKEWAGKYWEYADLLIKSLIISIALTAMAAASIIAYSRKRKSHSRVAFYMLLTAGALATLYSLYNLGCIDYLIHHELYQYGLQFSIEWASKYWIYIGLTSTLTIFSAAIATTSTALVFFTAGETTKKELPKLTCSTLIATGATAILLSTMYNSLILAFTGLGLTFWGIILAYIQPEDYVKRTILEAATLPNLATLNQIIQELNFEGKAIYLPPKYLKDQEESKAYIPKQKNDPMPTPEQIQEQENSLFCKNPNGMLVKPPGAELSKLFEKILQTSFLRIDLQQLQQTMPKLLIEDLEIAQTMEITTEKDKIHIKIENSNIQKLTEETQKLPKMHNSLGCPLTSAIACALAKVTGKPVTIENQKLNAETKTLEVEYRMLGEEERTKL
jgi:hypothetical protein